MQRGTFQLMKSVNKSIILNKIRTSEPISRAEIAKETKITPPTVSSIVKEPDRTRARERKHARPFERRKEADNAAHQHRCLLCHWH